MIRTIICACLTAGWISLSGASVALAQRAEGSLRIVVKDPSGAVVPGAVVQVKGAEERTASITRTNLPSDGQGIATAAGLTPGRYAVDVSFPGFETLTLPDVRVRTGDNRRDAVLKIQKLDETVSVGRDKATVASDPNNDRFNTVLSKAQVNRVGYSGVMTSPFFGRATAAMPGRRIDVGVRAGF